MWETWVLLISLYYRNSIKIGNMYLPVLSSAYPNRKLFWVFVEFFMILLLFYVLVLWPWGMLDLSSSTRDQACTPSTGRRSLNHWATREVPGSFISTKYCKHSENNSDDRTNTTDFPRPTEHRCQLLSYLPYTHFFLIIVLFWDH